MVLVDCQPPDVVFSIGRVRICNLFVRQLQFQAIWDTGKKLTGQKITRREEAVVGHQAGEVIKSGREVHQKIH
jgi:hypothetical protein